MISNNKYDLKDELAYFQTHFLRYYKYFPGFNLMPISHLYKINTFWI